MYTNLSVFCKSGSARRRDPPWDFEYVNGVFKNIFYPLYSSIFKDNYLQVDKDTS